jgi:hypothetical protein
MTDEEIKIKQKLQRAIQREKTANQLEKTARKLRQGLSPFEADKAKAASDARINRGRAPIDRPPKTAIPSRTDSPTRRSGYVQDRRVTPDKVQVKVSNVSKPATGRRNTKIPGRRVAQGEMTGPRMTPGRRATDYKSLANGGATVAKNAVRSNAGVFARARTAINSGVERGLGAAGRFAANTLPGRGVVRIANTVGKTAVGRAAGAVLSKTAVPLMVAGAAYDVGRTVYEGVGAYNAAQHQKRTEAHTKEKYGSIEAATRTRHENDRKRARVKEAIDK